MSDLKLGARVKIHNHPCVGRVTSVPVDHTMRWFVEYDAPHQGWGWYQPYEFEVLPDEPRPVSPDDVRMTAQLVVAKRVHCVSDDAVEAMARRVLELEVALDAARAVGVTVERREDGTGWAVTNTRAVEAEAAQGHIGSGDPVVWEPVPDDVVLAVCVHYRDELVKAFESAPDAATWRDVIEGVRMLNKPVRARGAR